MDNNYLIQYNYFDNPLVLPDFIIYQIGTIVCNENTYYPNHYHGKFYELTIITKGEGTVYTNSKPIPVKAGDIYLSCLHDIHAIKSSKTAPLQYDFCAFFPTDSKLADDLKDLASFLYPEHLRLFHSNNVSFLLPLAINEMSNLNKKHSVQLINSIFYQIAVYTYRILANEDITNLSVKNISNKNILCYQIMDYINSNMGEIRSLTELADKFHLSYNYLTKVFKNTTSMTIIDFYNMRRLTIAEQYITENILTLDQIAQKLNFATPYSLSKAFKKKYNLSPTHYRKLKNI